VVVFRRARGEASVATSAGGLPAEVGEDAADDAGAAASQDSDLAALRARLTVFGTAALATVIDLVFLAVWIWLHQVAGALFGWIGALSGMDGVVLGVLENLFTWSTLLTVVLYVLHDLWVSARRIWGAR
jgi:hypothetical protein